MDRWSCVVLVGVSGTGKTTVGRIVADRLGWAACDTDAEIERRLGATVPEIFAEHGELAFRRVERSVLADGLRREHTVVATGGGAVVAEDAWDPDLLGGKHVLTLALDARPETSLIRLQRQTVAEGSAAARPLLAGSDPLATIRGLKARRQRAYDRADVTLIVDNAGPERIAEEIVSLVRGHIAPVVLRSAQTESRIIVSAGALRCLGESLRETCPKARRVWIVTDDGVAPHHLAPAVSSVLEADLRCERRIVAHGEGSKSIEGASHLYDWMLGEGIERGDVVVALGGGVVGDLAGFVAATTLRGVGLVQVPTTLLAMVDSSVGGKTGINHRAGKNLIGAFYQPPLVIIDPHLLRTLPARELTSGWSEIIKHAVIQPSTPGGERADLWAFLERNASRLLEREDPALSYLIYRNVALKAAVVEQDEREVGLRAFLNFGHTMGHAIEAADYQLLHGEAVAVGMRAAMRLGERMGTCDATAVSRLDSLLDQFGLPATATAAPDRVAALLTSDKKRSDGKQRWVLPQQQGGVALRDDVPEGVVREVLATLLT